MSKVFSVLIFLLLLFVFSSQFLSLASAADVRGENILIIPSEEKNLNDLYLFGNSITVEAPVTNDLVAAGRDISVDNNVSGNIMAAGGTLRIKGNSGGSVRVAGGNIVIEGEVGRDLVVAGGTVTITKTATIAGDLLIAGGQLAIQGTVHGKAMINGGKALIEGIIDKQVEGNVGQLSIGPGAVIGGNLTYSSPEKATIEKSAMIKGTQHYTRIEKPKNETKQFGAIFATFSLYKLIGDILVSVALIFFLSKFMQTFVGRITSAPFRDFVWGLAFVALTPLISLFLLVFLLPGVAAFIIYSLVLVFSVYLAKVFAGWLVIRWWYRRQKKEYIVDWKAGVVGPLILFVAGFVPILGWLLIAILYMISVGALIQEFAAVAQTQRIIQKKK
jgi:hypothetical protein